MSILPGWHSTIFAPYFVAGAIFSGLAMVITLLIPLRKLLGIEEYITIRHFENLAKLIIVTSLIVGYAYLTEFFVAWYSGKPVRAGDVLQPDVRRLPALLLGACSPATSSFRWCSSSSAVRTNLAALFVISIFVNIGMWLERFVIIVTSLSHDFDPANWTGLYEPTWVEGAITVGSFSLFFMLFLIFIKNFPAISITEMKEGSAHAEVFDDQPGAVPLEARVPGPLLRAVPGVEPAGPGGVPAHRLRPPEEDAGRLAVADDQHVGRAGRRARGAGSGRAPARQARPGHRTRPVRPVAGVADCRLVREFDGHFDRDVDRAWRNTLAEGIEFMQSRHER